MAIGAGGSTGDVRIVLAGCSGAVVAGHTSADHLGVIHFQRGFECGSDMTTFTRAAGVDVSRVLAQCCRAVMAAEAIIGNAIMTEVRGLPRSRRMTAATISSGENVR